MWQCFGKTTAKCGHVSSGIMSSESTASPIKSKQYQSTGQENLNIQSKEQTSISKNLKVFTLNDLKTATKNFRSDTILGEGGFGCVFKGFINENPNEPGSRIVVAVKKLNLDSLQGHREWLTEVDYLGQFHHENLVKLIGYCSEFEHKLLVYEFMSRGSLANHLFRKGIQPINWGTRVRIAIDVARGLSFLHSINANIIYRDLKAANILLDAEYNAKLSDFGLARAGPTGDKTHVTTRVVGTQGYAAPEYVLTGHLTPKSDVYSFGVVLLELLSGRRALGHESNGHSEETLVNWAMPFLVDSRRVYRIMDTRLGGRYSKRGSQSVALLALECLHEDPKLRPDMTQALAQLEQIQNPSRDGTRVPHQLRTTGSPRPTPDQSTGK